jgi:hypothetical protein
VHVVGVRCSSSIVAVVVLALLSQGGSGSAVALSCWTAHAQLLPSLVGVALARLWPVLFGSQWLWLG